MPKTGSQSQQSDAKAREAIMDGTRRALTRMVIQPYITFLHRNADEKLRTYNIGNNPFRVIGYEDKLELGRIHSNLKPAAEIDLESLKNIYTALNESLKTLIMIVAEKEGNLKNWLSVPTYIEIFRGKTEIFSPEFVDHFGHLRKDRRTDTDFLAMFSGLLIVGFVNTWNQSSSSVAPQLFNFILLIVMAVFVASKYTKREANIAGGGSAKQKIANFLFVESNQKSEVSSLVDQKSVDPFKPDASVGETFRGDSAELQRETEKKLLEFFKELDSIRDLKPDNDSVVEETLSQQMCGKVFAFFRHFDLMVLCLKKIQRLEDLLRGNKIPLPIRQIIDTRFIQMLQTGLMPGVQIVPIDHPPTFDQINRAYDIFHNHIPRQMQALRGLIEEKPHQEGGPGQLRNRIRSDSREAGAVASIAPSDAAPSIQRPASMHPDTSSEQGPPGSGPSPAYQR